MLVRGPDVVRARYGALSARHRNAESDAALSVAAGRRNAEAQPFSVFAVGDSGGILAAAILHVGAEAIGGLADAVSGTASAGLLHAQIAGLPACAVTALPTGASLFRST